MADKSKDHDLSSLPTYPLAQSVTPKMLRRLAAIAGHIVRVCPEASFALTLHAAGRAAWGRALEAELEALLTGSGERIEALQAEASQAEIDATVENILRSQGGLDRDAV